MQLPKLDQTSDNEMPTVCIEVLRELIEDGAVKSDETGAIAALLIDFHGYGIIRHATLRRLALSKFVNRSLEPGEKILRVRPSYHCMANYYVMEIAKKIAEGD